MFDVLVQKFDLQRKKNWLHYSLGRCNTILSEFSNGTIIDSSC